MGLHFQHGQLQESTLPPILNASFSVMELSCDHLNITIFHDQDILFFYVLKIVISRNL